MRRCSRKASSRARDVPDKGQRWSRNHSREKGFKDTEAPSPRFEPTAAILEYRRAQAISICSLDSITFTFDKQNQVTGSSSNPCNTKRLGAIAPGLFC